jgi:hypothetical protein
VTDLQWLMAEVDSFAAAMKAKLRKKHREGKRGWWDPNWHASREPQQQLLDHFLKGDMVDVANFALFIHVANQRKDR